MIRKEPKNKFEAINLQLEDWVIGLGSSPSEPDSWWRSFGGNIRLLRDIWIEMSGAEKEELRATTPISKVVPCEFLDFLATETELSRKYAVSSLKNKLAAIVESFDAGSAWIFLRHEDVLILRAAANGASRMTKEPFMHCEQSPSIVSHVYRTEAGYLSNSVGNDPYFLNWIEDTKSEIAVPLIIDGKIVGVLNVETPVEDAFIEPHIAQLSAEAKSLLLDIAVLLNCELLGSNLIHPHLSSSFCSWHPGRFTWEANRFFSEICESISRSMSKSDSELDGQFYAEPACTYWYLDSEAKSLFARGTFGFNTEYISSSVLSVTDSRTGEAVTTGASKHLKGAELSRATKARNQRVSGARMTPLNDGGEVVGCLNVYHRTQSSPEVHDTFLQNSADLLIDVIKSQIELRSRLAKLDIESLVACSPAFSHDPFGVLLRGILRVLSADEGSIFIRIDDELVCASTTGLVGDLGGTIGPGDVCYDLRLPSDRGWTTHLGSYCGKSLRFNDVSAVTTLHGLRNRAKARERAAVSDPHIRFCGVSVGENSSHAFELPFGVIRLVRRSTSPPFLKEDLRLLAEIAANVKSVFENYLSMRQKRRPYSSRITYQPTAGSLRHAPATELRALLSNVVQLFRHSHGTFQASVRVVTNSSRGQGLLTFASYSALHSGVAEELESRVHIINGKEPRSIGWESIKRGTILWFHRGRAQKSNWFVPINKDSLDAVTEGVCVPFQWVDDKGKLLLGVVSLDCNCLPENSGVRWTNEDLNVLEDVAKQAALILGRRSVNAGLRGLSRSSDYDLQQFVLNICNSVRADWYSLAMTGNTSFPSQDLYAERHPVITDWQERSIPISSGLQRTFEVGQGGKACRVKFRGICADACELAVGNGSVKFAKEFENKLPGMTASWNAVSYLLSPEWESAWDFGHEENGIVAFISGSNSWRRDFIDRLQFAMIPYVRSGSSP